jgi:hypothetical protein
MRWKLCEDEPLLPTHAKKELDVSRQGKYKAPVYTLCLLQSGG